MATTKKGKKKTAPKKGSKPKKNSKKNNSGNIFTKIMLIILLLAILATATFMILTNIKHEAKDKDNKAEVTIMKNDSTDESRKQKPEIKETVIKEETSAEKKETKREEAAPKEEVKSETKKENDAEVEVNVKPEVIDLKKEFKENQTLSGCWFSTTQGSALTMDEYGYRIDFSGVDASEPITGKYSVEGNLIIFLNESSGCEGIEGIYRISFDKKNINLSCKDDECKERKNVMEAEWEWIEI